MTAWFGSERHVEQSVAQAQRIAARHRLPATARSLTRPELLDVHRNVIGIATIGLLLFLLVALFVVARQGGGMTGFVLLLLLVALPAMFVAGSVRMRRHQDYRDPRIRIVADAEGVAFTNPAGAQTVGWLELEASVSYVTSKGGATFLGLKLESPFGRILLEDGWYRNGRNLAAAIVQGKLQAEEARERAKAGIAPAD